MALYQIYEKNESNSFRSNKNIYSNQIDNILQGKQTVVEYKWANKKCE